MMDSLLLEERAHPCEDTHRRSQYEFPGGSKKGGQHCPKPLLRGNSGGAAQHQSGKAVFGHLVSLPKLRVCFTWHKLKCRQAFRKRLAVCVRINGVRYERSAHDSGPSEKPSRV